MRSISLQPGGWAGMTGAVGGLLLLAIMWCGCSREPPRANSSPSRVVAADSTDVNPQTPMDPYMAALFASPDDSELVGGVFSRVAQKCDGSNADEVSRLSREERVVLQVYGTCGIIGNGGFQYLFEHDLDFSSLADSYAAIGLDDAAGAIRAALALFPQSKPHFDVDERLEYLAHLGAGTRDKLKGYSESVWNSDRKLHRRLSEFVRSNKEAFVRLPPTPWEKIEDLKKKDLPVPAAGSSEETILAWLESIGARASRWSDLTDYDRQRLTPPASGDPIVGIWLSNHRNSTDEEIALLLRYDSLSEMRKLDLEKTYISETGLRALDRFPRLESLDLSETDAQDDWLTVIRTLSSLRELNLSRTEIGDVGLQHLAGQTLLRELVLDYTKVTDEGFGPMSRLPKLSSLSLYATKVRGSKLTQLAICPNLRVLRLSETPITDETLSGLAQLRNLTNLDISGTLAGDAVLSQIANLAALERLVLSETRVTDASLRHLSRLTALKELDLDVTDIGDRALSYLSQLERLEKLNLYKTRVGDESLRHLGKLTSLAELWLSQTRVTDDGLKFLVPLTQLRSLSLDDTVVSGGPELLHLASLQSLEYLSLPARVRHSSNIRLLQQKLGMTRFSFD